MNNDIVNLTTPRARFVGGSLSEGTTKGYEGKPLTFQDGSTRTKYWFAVAIPKQAPEWPAIQQAIIGVGMTSNPQHFDAQGSCIFPTFAWKMKDGDSTSVNQKGNRDCDKEGYPGHWILEFTGSEPPKLSMPDGAGGYQDILDPKMIKRGFYVRVAFNVTGNTTSNPGVYLNHRIVLLDSEGPEIRGGISADEAFGPSQAGGVVPGQAMPQTALPGQAMPQTALPGQAMPQTALPGQVAQVGQPHYAILDTPVSPSPHAPSQATGPVSGGLGGVQSADAPVNLNLFYNVQGRGLIQGQVLLNEGWQPAQIQTLGAGHADSIPF